MIVLVVPLTVVLLVFAAFVVDLGNARQLKRQEQGAVDAAALAGVAELDAVAPTPSQQAAARAQAAKYAAEGLFDGAPPAVVPTACPGGDAHTGCYTIGDAYVEVTTPYSLLNSSLPPHRLLRVEACRDMPTAFGKVAGVDELRPCAEGVARVTPAAGAVGRGLIVLDPEAPSALLKEGNGRLTVNGGHVIVNSSNAAAAQCNSTNGGIFTPDGSTMIRGGRGGGACIHPGEEPGSEPVPDPLAALQPPVSAGMTSRSVDGSSVTSMLPGRYGTNVTISGPGRTITMASGVYWFDNGFWCEGNTKTLVSGPGGVTIYIAGGKLRLAGGCQANLHPPTSGPYEQITVFQSRANTTQSEIEGNSIGFAGTIYMPSNRLRIAGNGSQTFDAAMVVAQRVNVAGNGTFVLNTDEPPQAAAQSAGIGLER